MDNISCILNTAIDLLVESNQEGDRNMCKIVLVGNSSMEELSAKALEDNRQEQGTHTYRYAPIQVVCSTFGK